ncbi:hypothetical protein ABAC460_10855 [Asticcacaulis sp. AC460]|uniref:DUF2147 domain-containing protein n=1 Tax=Asticcacaulis sp. AC460 TaxID=1282360 RepID=UPI0003C3F12F|nr:DUF2147 domain-containing protein [Asticcacaulis sp. AC460]ESQ90240.1 hypothetical protein ABAC460_10855 [Asticcacaulis sp. AC460]
MRHTLMTVVALGVLWAMPAMASPEGDWARGDGKARVKIAPCGADLCAVNTWIKAGVKDEKVGDKLVMSVKNEGGTWKGRAFDPQRNLHYRLTITLGGEAMTTSGCVLGGLVCKKMTWTRI